MARRQVTRTEGVGILLQGLGPTAAGYAIQGGLKYGLYEVFKTLAASGLGLPRGGGLPLPLLLAGAAAAELVGATALCPWEAARIRLVADPSFAAGLRPALGRLAAEGGVGGLFATLPAMYLKQVPYTMCQLATYDWVTRTLYRQLQAQAGLANSISLGDWAPLVIAVAGASAAAISSSLASQPGDTLLSKLNQGGRLRRKPGAEGDTEAGGAPVAGGSGCTPMCELATRLGPSGLMLGWDARLMHTGTIVLVQLLIYDAVKSAVGLPVTGQHSRRALFL